MSGEKTEQPTQKKLNDARKKGQVALSKDVVSTALLLSLMALLLTQWRWYFDTLRELIVLPSNFIGMDFDEAFPAVVAAMIQVAVKLSLPIILIVVAVAIISNVAQVGPLLVFDPVKPELKKLDPIARLKQMFSLKNFFEFGKSLVKILFLSALIIYLIRGSVGPLMSLPSGGMDAVIAATIALLWRLALLTGLAYTIFAVADFAFQKYEYTKGLRMSKDEIKREYKEMEGDPTIKSKRRQLHQELASGGAEQRVKKSNVLVVNPTHLAIALYYNRGETKLPIVLAKAEGERAALLRSIAEREGIPVMQNITLARALFNTVDVEQYIPSDLIEPVAEVLRWVQSLGYHNQDDLPTTP
jgi:type III secretion protein U